MTSSSPAAIVVATHVPGSGRPGSGSSRRKPASRIATSSAGSPTSSVGSRARPPSVVYGAMQARSFGSTHAGLPPGSRGRVARGAHRLDVEGRVIQAHKRVAGHVDVVHAFSREEPSRTSTQPGGHDEDRDLGGHRAELPPDAPEEPIDIPRPHRTARLDRDPRKGLRTLYFDRGVANHAGGRPFAAVPGQCDGPARRHATVLGRSSGRQRPRDPRRLRLRGESQRAEASVSHTSRPRRRRSAAPR
jgi:hypothetical protein